MTLKAPQSPGLLKELSDILKRIYGIVIGAVILFTGHAALGANLMKDISKIDYSSFDQPEILAHVFHPRPEHAALDSTGAWKDMLIPVEQGYAVGARLHHQNKTAPTILFFHGNGEIVADYDDIGQLYAKIDINLFAADYRGYGRSTGSPSMTGMMRDSHMVFRYAKKWLNENGYTGPVIIMGRSLGSASALEIAASYKNEIDGLIIESGFAFIMPLLKLIGVNTTVFNITEENGPCNITKIKTFNKPTLIIHAQHDHIIPFSEGRALYDASPGPDKTMLQVKGADHNTVFFHGIEDYLKAVKALAESAGK